MLKRIVRLWWLFLGLFILWPEGSLWQINVAEIFATIVIVIGVVWTLRGWWHGHRQVTLIKMKYISHQWPEETFTLRVPTFVLTVTLDLFARKPYQATYVEGIIGGRHCRSDPPAFFPNRHEKRTLRFEVPSDAVSMKNSGYVCVEFGGSTFQSDVFEISPMPSNTLVG